VGGRDMKGKCKSILNSNVETRNKVKETSVAIPVNKTK
jgi:hypothetical protein